MDGRRAQGRRNSRNVARYVIIIYEKIESIAVSVHETPSPSPPQLQVYHMYVIYSKLTTVACFSLIAFTVHTRIAR